MLAPYELIERSLNVHGDTTYQLALLLTGDAPGAQRLLRALVVDLLTAPPASLPDEADLLARLLVTFRATTAKRSLRNHASQPGTDQPPIYRAICGLPADQRFMLGLYLISGYDLKRMAQTMAADEASARASLLAAMQLIAPVIEVALPTETSAESCLEVRDALVDPAGRLRHAPAMRGHLAACVHCRGFDHAWGKLCLAVEADLRTALRAHDLPASLKTRLLALARPTHRARPSLRMALPALAVLLIIAILVLPGITRKPVTVVNRANAAQIDVQAIIQRALAAQTRPPEADASIWHARYQTSWYFEGDVFAPLHADIWVDRTNPARHRLQLTHADGGAPYEIQLGDGIDLLYYALDPIYASTLYGSLDVGVSQGQPTLRSLIVDPSTQSSAFASRISYGAWNIPSFYLRQAQVARDLRALGRQRDGDRSVQILSFSGLSPLNKPADAPGDVAQRVTVMLALDVDDGRLRRVTELTGPTSGAQTSRVIWQLFEEQNFDSSAEAGSPFEIAQAWKGRGRFPTPNADLFADPAMPLISALTLGDPAMLLDGQHAQFWLPATAPSGTERILLIWPRLYTDNTSMPESVVYLGPDRRLILNFQVSGYLDAAEELRVGIWNTRIKPGRARSYQAQIIKDLDSDVLGSEPINGIQLDAHGFSHAEIVALIESLRPLDFATLAAQDRLFLAPNDQSAAARAALLKLLAAEVLPPDTVRYSSMLFYSNPDQYGPDQRADPYHRPLNQGLPETVRYEIWRAQAGDEQVLMTRLSDPQDSSRTLTSYRNARTGWSYNPSISSLELWLPEDLAEAVSRPTVYQILISMLMAQNGTLRDQPTESGRLISNTYPLDPANDLYWRALQIQGSGLIQLPTQEEQIDYTAEVEISPAGELLALRVIMSIHATGSEDAASTSPSAGADKPTQMVLMSFTQIEGRMMSVADAPEALRSDDLPQAQIVRDYRIFSPRISQQLTPESLQAARGLVGVPYYALATESAAISQLEYSPSGPSINMAPSYSAEPIFDSAVHIGLALRTSYLMPGTSPDTQVEVRVFQGEASLLGAYLASASDVTWQQSAPLRLNLAGRELDAWDARSPSQRYLLAEVDGQLLIVSVPLSMSDATLYDLLARLQLMG